VNAAPEFQEAQLHLFTTSDALKGGSESPSTQVDLLRAMWLVDSEDAALPWNSASVMGDVVEVVAD
jgi:hypothetical protein